MLRKTDSHFLIENLKKFLQYIRTSLTKSTFLIVTNNYDLLLQQKDHDTKTYICTIIFRGTNNWNIHTTSGGHRFEEETTVARQ